MIIVLLLIAAPVSYPKFLAQTEAAFQQSPLAQQLGLSLQSETQGVRARLAQSPFTVAVSGSGTWYQPYPAGYVAYPLWTSDPQRIFAVGPTASLTYQPRSTFAATLSTTYTFASLQLPTAYRSPSNPFTLTLNLTYDLVQGGFESTQWLQADSAAAGVLSQQLGTSQQALDARANFVQVMTTVYATSCKISVLSSVRKQIDETVESAKLQLKTRLISQKDYFNYANLDSSFATQLNQLQADLAQLYEQARTYGTAAWQLLESVEKNGAVCDIDVASTLAQSKSKVIADGDLDRWASVLPVTLGAEASERSARYNAAAVKKGFLPSVLPFVTGQLGEPEYVTKPLVQVMGGLSFNWNVPGARGTYATNEAVLAASAARALADNTFLQTRAILRQINAQFAQQSQVLEVLQKALSNAELLLKTLEAQRSIGQVDSLNFSTAYLNLVSVREATLDAWAIIESSVFQRDLYERWINATRPGSREALLSGNVKSH